MNPRMAIDDRRNWPHPRMVPPASPGNHPEKVHIPITWPTIVGTSIAEIGVFLDAWQ
jgi:hypothetical protein